MRRVLRSIQAESDLAEIWLHIALDNPDAADAQLSRVAAQCEMLAGNPWAGRLRPEIRAGLRSFPVGGARELFHLFSGVEEPRAEYRLAG
jgi:toxin ParE1/3/4